MEFFSDFNVPKDKKIGITNVLSNITTKDHSHKGGWTKLLRCQLINLGYSDVTILNNKHKLNEFDVIIFDQGAEYKGAINLFGGLDEKCWDRICELALFNGCNPNMIFSWQHEVPDLGQLIKSRLGNKSTYDRFYEKTDEEINSISELCKDIRVFDHVEWKSHIIFGDSHTPSVWTPEMMIFRQDGRTLFGSLKKDGLGEVSHDINIEINRNISEITFYAGNIDIRHHLMRQENPWESAIQLIRNLENSLQRFAPTCNINVVQMLPIEDESRKLPKTGYYKGTPFYGAWNERSALHEIINDKIEEICSRNGWRVYKHPSMFYNQQGQLKFDVMERPKSIHLSPMFYRWDLENNKERFNGSSN